MARPHTLKRHEMLWRTGVAIVLAVAIPLFTSLAEGKGGLPLLDGYQSFVVGAFIFVVASLTQLSYELNQLVKIRQREAELWSRKADVDDVLAEIRSDFYKIVENGPATGRNLFAMYFANLVRDLASKIHEAASKKEMKVDELTIGATELLMQAMATGGPHRVQLVHLLDARPNNFDCSTWAKSYYNSLTALAKNKQVSVERVFIYSSVEELEDGLTQYLFQFHANNPGYDYRVIKRNDWSRLLEGYGLGAGQGEIGVWGDSLAYATHRSSKTKMEGAYTASEQEIRRYRSVLDAAWNLGYSPPRPKDRKRVSVDDLFDLAESHSSPT